MFASSGILSFFHNFFKEEDPPEGGNAGALEEEEEGDLPSLAPQPSEEPTAIVNQNGR